MSVDRKYVAGRAQAILLVFLFLSLITAFSPIYRNEKKPKGGLVISFDDRNMLHWEKKIPLFKKYDAHVTFFIDRFDELTPEQLKALHALEEAGHTIGCHGLRHRRAVEYVDKYSIQQYMEDEIFPAISAMKENGFSPTSFAYPYSNHNGTIDKELLKYFKRLRSGIKINGSITDTDGAFVKVTDLYNTRRMNGISFHPKSASDDLILQVRDAMKRITKQDEILILYAHDIRNADEEGPKNFITDDALEELLASAKRNNVRLYSFGELH